MNQDEKKIKVAEAGLEHIETGQIVGIGSGTTVHALIEKIDKVSEIFHFDDGTIRVFNLLSDEIRVDSINANNKEIKVNKVIPSSKFQSLSFVDIKTEFTGSYSEAI